MIQWLVLSAQILFTICNFFCLVFDSILFLCVLKQRFSISKSTGPFVYILFLTGFGIVEKINAFLMVDAWPVTEWFYPNQGYERYRNFMGAYVTFVFLLCYLTPLFIDCIMTIHRLCIYISPIKSTTWFKDTRLICYCIITSVVLLIWLLIQQVSNCTLNFNALTSFLESACAPDRHPVTWFQNKYLIYVPISSMLVNAMMLFAQRLSRKYWKNSVFAHASSNSQLRRENALIRQALFIGGYLSLYEILYLHTRLYPESFRSMPFEFQTITYDLRLLAVGSLNFFVYFVLTKSTRGFVLSFFGISPKKNIKISISQTTAKA